MHVLSDSPENCLQDWLSDEDVSRWLNKYDWDASGDISFDEFEGMVSSCCPSMPNRTTAQPKKESRSPLLH